MTKIVINDRIGGFSISGKAFNRLLELGNADAIEEAETLSLIEAKELYCPCMLIPRDDPQLIQVIEEMGKDANGDLCHLKIVNIPDDIKWYVTSGEDGRESIHEIHRIWS